jgi:PPOX class probable F420-dependent enzyme
MICGDNAPMPTPQPIPAAFHELLNRPVLMTLATQLADGSAQLTPVWFSFDGTHIYFNCEKGKLKDRILRKRPYVSLIILDPDNKARWVAVRGPVIEIADDVNREHANALTMKYMGVDKFPAPPEEQRVRYTVLPEHVSAAELYAPR